MIVTLDEIKQYLRVDYPDDDSILNEILTGAQKLCMDVARTDDADAFARVENAKVAVMYAAAYLYEHREEADHHALTLTLRSLLFAAREEASF